jgi:Arc/MetJ-type ribon-helix-helix transcriptional regulator
MKHLSKKNTDQKTAPKAVRATFSLPASTIDEMERLRQKLASVGFILNRSELVRVGLVALELLSGKNVEKAIAEIDRLKAGRPKSIGSD